MLQNVGQPLVFTASFRKTGYWVNPTGGVAVNIYRRRADTGAVELLVAGGAAQSIGFGNYAYRLAAADAAGTYFATFETGDLTVDERAQFDKWHVGLSSVLRVEATIPPSENGAFAGALSAQSQVRFEQSLQATGIDITGYTALTFTIKRDADSDMDSDALLTVRVSSPVDSATDGIIWFRGKAVDSADPLRLSGTIFVESAGPDAILTIIVAAAGMDMPPSAETAPYDYEMNYWIAGDKRQHARGDMEIAQSVRRSTGVP